MHRKDTPWRLQYEVQPEHVISYCNKNKIKVQIVEIDIEKQKPEYALIPDIPENFEAIIEKTSLDIESLEMTILNQVEISEDKNTANASSVIASSNLPELSIDEIKITLKFINPTWIQIRNSEDQIILSQ